MLSFRGGNSYRSSSQRNGMIAAQVESSANETELFTEEKAEVPENRNSLTVELGNSCNEFSPSGAAPDLVGHEIDGWSNVVIATPGVGGASSSSTKEEPAFFSLFGSMGGPSSADVDPDLGLDLTAQHEFRPERRASFITGMGARFNALFATGQGIELYRPATRDADTQTFWEVEPEPAPPRRRSIFQQIGDVRRRPWSRSLLPHPTDPTRQLLPCAVRSPTHPLPLPLDALSPLPGPHRADDFCQDLQGDSR